MRQAPLPSAIFGGALLVVCQASGVCAADGATGWAPIVEAGLASDYLFRGVDQTRGRGEGFVSVEADGRSARVGAFASNVVAPTLSGASTRAEGDLYGGWLTSVEGFDFETGAIGYLFSGARSRPDMLEPYARLGRTLGPARLSATVNYGVFGEHAAHEGYAEVKAEYPITPKWSVSGGAGHLYETQPDVLDALKDAAVQHALNATTWSLGATYAFSEKISFRLEWSYIDHHAPDMTNRIFGVVKARPF